MATFRVPQIDLATLLSEPNPTIDLRITSYEHSARNFLKAVTNYKSRSITTLAHKRKQEVAERKKNEDKAKAVEEEIQMCKIREVELVTQLEREKEERKEAELHLASCKRQHATLKEKVTSIDADIDHYRAISKNLKKEKKKDQNLLGQNASHILPQLSAWENRLSCTIEGVEQNRLLVCFTNVCALQPQDKVSFVLDIATEPFKVIIATPNLPSMSVLVTELNETGDVYYFLQQVHKEYYKLLNN